MFVATKIYKKCANLWENVQFDNMMTKAVHPHVNVAIYTFLRGEKLSQKLCLWRKNYKYQALEVVVVVVVVVVCDEDGGIEFSSSWMPPPKIDRSCVSTKINLRLWM